jgi:hypothetical protein
MKIGTRDKGQVDVGNGVVIDCLTSGRLCSMIVVDIYVKYSLN